MSINKYHDNENIIDNDNEILICAECGEITEDSHYRDDDTETVCEDCYIEWLAKKLPDNNK